MLSALDAAASEEAEEGVEAPPPGEAAEADIDVAAALKRDTTLLSSYGWQSEGESRAPMSYYSFAKSPSDVLTSIAWSKGGGGAPD